MGQRVPHFLLLVPPDQVRRARDRWPASLPPAPTRLWEEVSLEGIRR